MSAGTDGFRLAYDRIGAGPAVVLLHGWPGDRTDYREVASLLTEFDVVVPDLRGFGGSDKHVAAPAQYGMDGQARAVLGLVDELGLDRPLLAGYDIGSRIAQAAARARPELVRALVVSPPLPGIGQRVLEPQPQREFWYQHFHQLELAEQLIDGRPDAVRAYLRYFWSHWSGPNFTLPAEQLEHLVSVYSPPGAFTASINWYRAGAGAVARSLAERTPDPADRLTTPTTVLWPDLDPLYPPVWSDRVTEYFTTVHLQHLDVGHFTPLESPDKFAAAIRAS
jgi:pimeloyl-ACP methyl ester carboxylesterase